MGGVDTFGQRSMIAHIDSEPGLPNRKEAVRAQGWSGGRAPKFGTRLRAGFDRTMDSENVNVGFVADTPTGGLPPWKRLLDLSVISFLSPALLIIGVGLALLIKCGSSGPILFRQRRVGYRGREFTCYKLRTMRENAETKSHQDYTRQLMEAEVPMTKMDARNDCRLIPLGAALRATGLDELPQLLNVLRGEMSMVGPRPCIPYEYEHYQPRHRRRFDAVPGLTGLWQVSGKNNTTFNQMIELDIQYSRQSSLWLDIKIIIKTLPALWKQCLEMRDSRRNRAASPAMLKSI